MPDFLVLHLYILAVPVKLIPFFPRNKIFSYSNSGSNTKLLLITFAIPCTTQTNNTWILKVIIRIAGEEKGTTKGKHVGGPSDNGNGEWFVMIILC